MVNQDTTHIYIIEISRSDKTGTAIAFPPSLEEARAIVQRSNVLKILHWKETEWVEIKTLPVL